MIKLKLDTSCMHIEISKPRDRLRPVRVTILYATNQYLRQQASR